MKKNSSVLVFRRIAAFLYDCLLLLALFMLITAIAVRLNNGEAIEHAAYKLTLLPIAWLFFAWFWSHGGQTLGMRAWRIKIFDNDKRSMSFVRAYLRAMAGPLVLPAEYIYRLLGKSVENTDRGFFFGRIERVK